MRLGAYQRGELGRRCVRAEQVNLVHRCDGTGRNRPGIHEERRRNAQAIEHGKGLIHLFAQPVVERDEQRPRR
ncbi:MAG: hypothetical protein AUG84_00240 [Chloroflexi bacterium 13_1_20CM_4_66_7]|nr:MAG: hypothetical protein AUG84_00240 [Chloroflexi bacterium 13_1_20CM_4_66_7]